MLSPNEAFAQLVDANPVDVVPVAKQSAAEFVADRATDHVLLTPPPSLRRLSNRGPLIGLAVLIVILAFGLLNLLNTQNEDDVVITLPTPTTLPVPTTVESLSPARQIAEGLADAWSAGDIEAIQAFLAEGTEFGWTRSSDFAAGPVLWSDAELQARVAIDAALRMTIELTGCEDFDERRISCAILKTDDLVRAQQIEPVGDVRWRLTIEDSQVTEWVEFTPDLSDYFLNAREPFHEWLDVAHPEVERPYVFNRGAPWRADTNFADIAADLVSEYAAGLGVDLSNP